MLASNLYHLKSTTGWGKDLKPSWGIGIDRHYSKIGGTPCQQKKTSSVYHIVRIVYELCLCSRARSLVQQQHNSQIVFCATKRMRCQLRPCDRLLRRCCWWNPLRRHHLDRIRVTTRYDSFPGRSQRWKTTSLTGWVAIHRLVEIVFQLPSCKGDLNLQIIFCGAGWFIEHSIINVCGSKWGFYRDLKIYDYSMI